MKYPLFGKYARCDENFFDSLEKNYLFFSKPNQLNDLFDCRFEPVIPKETIKIQRLFEKILSFQKTKSDRRSVEKKAANYTRSWQSQTAAQKYDFLSHILFDLYSNSTQVLVCSLSNTWTSPTMWAHYAGNYSGALILFKGNEGIFNKASAVHYTETMPKVNLQDLFKTNIRRHDILLTKSIHWAYENEFRIISDLNRLKNQKMVYDPSCIELIALGPRISDINKKRIVDILRKKKVRADVVNVSPQHNRYQLLFQSLQDELS